VRAAFYCVADARYFLGAVALVNSLRLQGHDEPIHLLDCGLTAPQRELMAAEVRLVPAPRDAAPQVLKAIAPLRGPAETMVLIDVDMIATQHLGSLFEAAGEDAVVAIADPQERFFSEWGELLGLGSARRLRYVSSGLVACGDETGRRILELLDAKAPRVDFSRTFWGANDRDYPFLYADQDLLNAILATSIDPAKVHALEPRLAATPPFRGLRIEDEDRLACSYRDGLSPLVVHQFARKPWIEETYDGVYSRLLRRLLVGDELAVRPSVEEVPLRLRQGSRARAERARVNASDFLRWRLGDRLPGPIARRVEDRRRRREGMRG
jgi:hypothetical protein